MKAFDNDITVRGNQRVRTHIYTGDRSMTVAAKLQAQADLRAHLKSQKDTDVIVPYKEPLYRDGMREGVWKSRERQKLIDGGML